jgi:hypothetical protein
VDPGPVGRLTARRALSVVAVLVLAAVSLFAVALLGPLTVPLSEVLAEQLLAVGVFCVALAAVVVAGRAVFHRLFATPARPAVRYEHRVRLAESAFAGVALLAATWVYGFDHVRNNVLRVPWVGIVVGALAALGLLLLVPTHVALVVADPDGEPKR